MRLRCVMFSYEHDDEPNTFHYVCEEPDYHREKRLAVEYMDNEMGVSDVALREIRILESYDVSSVDGYKINLTEGDDGDGEI
jgi:hypothetical protein